MMCIGHLNSAGERRRVARRSAAQCSITVTACTLSCLRAALRVALCISLATIGQLAINYATYSEGWCRRARPNPVTAVMLLLLLWRRDAWTGLACSVIMNHGRVCALLVYRTVKWKIKKNLYGPRRRTVDLYASAGEPCCDLDIWFHDLANALSNANWHGDVSLESLHCVSRN